MADVAVRPARVADADEVAALQARAWRAAYVDALPSEVLAGLDEPALAAGWRDAVTDPPSARHRLLVATAGDRVVGLAASAPAEDDDLDPGTDTELLLLLVDPDAGRAGHGSRLLAATVDLAREDGVRRLVAWLLEADAVTRGFLETAGWAADGASRVLDAGAPVRQVRLHTTIG